jgi:lipooligosaccharide transport system permease protein
LRPLVQLVPLYHGVALARAAAYGNASIGPVLAPVAFLAVIAALGIAWGRHTLRRRLVD